MVVGTKCRANGHVPAYGPCAASRVRCAGSRFALTALDPASSLRAVVIAQKNPTVAALRVILPAVKFHTKRHRATFPAEEAAQSSDQA